MRGPQRALGLACFASAVSSFAIFAAPDAPASFLRSALLLAALAAFIVAPAALLWWLGSRAAKAERARERRQAGAAWRAALAEASTSAASREPAISAPIERDDALAPSRAGVAPDGHGDRLEQAIATEIAHLAAARERIPERALYLNDAVISGTPPFSTTAFLQHRSL
jgi:hypothetical protein